jgi:hypothetical protein
MSELLRPFLFVTLRTSQIGTAMTIAKMTKLHTVTARGAPISPTIRA